VPSGCLKTSSICNSNFGTKELGIRNYTVSGCCESIDCYTEFLE
jgi:hypothetical protein